MRSTIRSVAATTATVLVFALTATVFALMAPPAAQARVIDCVVQPQPSQGACYEPVWVNGQQIIMTFPQAGVPLQEVPSAKTQPWYILGPQTGTAQGQTPGFFHDHVITTAPSEGGFTPFLHGYFVICSPEGISTGACTYNVETPPGGVPLPLTQSGHRLLPQVRCGHPGRRQRRPRHPDRHRDGDHRHRRAEQLAPGNLNDRPTPRRGQDGYRHHHRKRWAPRVSTSGDRPGLRLFFLATILTSVPAYFVGYHQMLTNPGLITGAGANPARGIATGAALEVLLIISNVATAVVAYPVLKRESEMGASGYVAARLVEAMFIAIGIISALAFVLMRQEATAASNPVLGHVFVSIYYRAFLVGPGFFAGLANGVILGYLMYRSELVPRGMTWLGLIGGPLVMITGVLIMYNAIPRGGAIQDIATLPEALWELSLSIYCIVKGFRLTSPILRPDGVTTRPESDSALRHELLQPDP